LDPKRVDELYDRLLDLEKVSDIREMAGLLVP
jgi:hypothetical protein